MAAAVEPPPTYEQATRSHSSPPTPLPTEHNGIPLRTRRSMEDELRPLPDRWVRTFDPNTQHQFFVDTVSAPPRAIWHHPYDDEDYLSTISPLERERIHRQYGDHTGISTGTTAPPSIDSNNTSIESPTRHPNSPTPVRPSIPNRASSTPGPSSTPSPPPNPNPNLAHDDTSTQRTLGRRLKDALTGTTHDQRVAFRASAYADLDAEEREMYRQHRILRKGMQDAMNSGEAQLLGKDHDGKEVYLEPPGHTFPAVGKVKQLSPYLSEVWYVDRVGRSEGEKGKGEVEEGVIDEVHGQDGEVGGMGIRGRKGGKGGGSGMDKYPGQEAMEKRERERRYLRPAGNMYGFGYGGYDCGMYGGGRWDKPGDEYNRGYKRGWGGGLGGGMALPLMVPLFGGMMLGSLMF